MYLLGIDLGSSSIKVALVDGNANEVKGVLSYPETEMEMISKQAGWAEQDPEAWWDYVCIGTMLLLKKTGIKGSDIGGIGISYQMHGLVTVDDHQKVLRPSIIWCDSRAVLIGEDAEQSLGSDVCHSHLLNSPGNFTASKLKWVKENEQHLYSKLSKFLLPGDYLAMKMTGEENTTISGLSEGMFWDFKNHEVAGFLMDNMGFQKSIVPKIVPTFGLQGELTSEAAKVLGLRPGTPVGYRAGDQPNNALSLGVINPGEIAATGGTSGVVYGVQNHLIYDKKSRVNSFAHVNHTKDDPRIGVLLCINGTGIQYRWIKDLMAHNGESYDDLEKQLKSIPPGSDGISVIPFGNGAERMLGNRDLGAQILNLQFNRHKSAHLYRAAIEGIAFSFIYGLEVFKEIGLDVSLFKVGNDNLFQSKVFSDTVSTLSGAPIDMVSTTGAIGAARGAGYGIGHFNSLDEAVGGGQVLRTYEPNNELSPALKAAYERWKSDLNKFIK